MYYAQNIFWVAIRCVNILFIKCTSVSYKNPWHTDPKNHLVLVGISTHTYIDIFLGGWTLEKHFPDLSISSMLPINLPNYRLKYLFTTSKCKSDVVGFYWSVRRVLVSIRKFRQFSIIYNVFLTQKELIKFTPLYPWPTFDYLVISLPNVISFYLKKFTMLPCSIAPLFSLKYVVKNDRLLLLLSSLYNF